MLKYCTHKMRAFFQGIEIQENRGGSTPALLRTVGFVRQEERLEILVFCLLWFLLFFSPLAVVWYYKQLEAHRKYDFM